MPISPSRSSATAGFPSDAGESTCFPISQRGLQEEKVIEMLAHSFSNRNNPGFGLWRDGVRALDALAADRVIVRLVGGFALGFCCRGQ